MRSDFRIGHWLVRPELNTVVTAGRETRVEPKVMEVLVYLAECAGQVVQRETLIRDVWGDTFVTDAALTRCIAELRRLFDDDVRDPPVIQTIAKSGYRLIAAVGPVDPANRIHRFAPALLVAAGIAAGAAAVFLVGPRGAFQARIVRAALPLGKDPLLLEEERPGSSLEIGRAHV